MREPPHSDLPGVHPPRQARSRATRQKIVRAARALMDEGGLEAVTVQEVLQRADIGAGSFYARFDGREALVHYLHHELWSGAERWWREFLEPARWRDASLAAVAGEVTRVLVRAHFVREVELRAFWVHALSRPAERVMEKTADADAAFVEGLAQLLEAGERRSGIRHPRPERAARQGAFQLLVTLRGHLLFPDSLSLEGGFSFPEMTLELVRGLLGYLGAEEAPETYAELLQAAPRGGG